MTTAVDVQVFGAGPAGLAAALRLHALGYRVAIVERTSFPRFQIGESLTRGVGQLLDRLTATDAVAATPMLQGLATLRLWEGEQELRSSVDRGGGAMVSRASFDGALLDLAVSRGIQLHVGHHPMAAKVGIDARGRSAPGRRIATGTPTVAIWLDDPNAVLPQTRMEALSSGWLWGAPLPGGGSRVLALVDPCYLEVCGGARRAMESLLAQSRLFTPRATTHPIRGCDATATIVSETSDGPGQPMFRAGEAAFTVDPISSSGVECALRSGLQASAAVHTVLTGGKVSLAHAFLGERMVEVIASHARWAQQQYAAAAMTGPFWQRRSSLTPPEPETPLLEALKTNMEWQPPRDPARSVCGWDSQVRLAADVRLEHRPCLEGDLVIARPVVTHPSLERPVAFVGDHDLASLLADVQPGSLQALVDRWSTRLHRQEACRLAGWSLRKGLLQLC